MFGEDEEKAAPAHRLHPRPRAEIGGLTVPLNIFLYQEVQRLSRVITLVRAMLIQMQLAIKGEVVLTSELQGAMLDLFNAKVPRSWVYTPGGDEFSWLSPTLGLWLTTLIDRDEQNRSWLKHGRPNSFWIAGFFNPQGFLTAMKQEVTRAHQSAKWALNVSRRPGLHTNASGPSRGSRLEPSSGVLRVARASPPLSPTSSPGRDVLLRGDRV